jgi:hypothetical protein
MTEHQSNQTLEAITDAVLLSLPGEMPLNQKISLANLIRRDAAVRIKAVAETSEAA